VQITFSLTEHTRVFERPGERYEHLYLKGTARLEQDEIEMTSNEIEMLHSLIKSMADRRYADASAAVR
jgi:hypothetical protein